MTRYFDIYPTETDLVEQPSNDGNELIFTSKQLHGQEQQDHATLLLALAAFVTAVLLALCLWYFVRRRQRSSSMEVANVVVPHTSAVSLTTRRSPELMWFHVRLLLYLNVGLLVALALHRYGNWLEASSFDWVDQISLLSHWRFLALGAVVLFLLAQVPSVGAAVLLVCALSAVKIAAVSFVVLTLIDVLLLYSFIDLEQQAQFLALLALNWALLIAGFHQWFGLF
jgi:hypothetical protein